MDNNVNCANVIISEDYANFIAERNSITDDSLNNIPNLCYQNVGTATILYTSLDSISDYGLNAVPYANTPKLYGLTDTSAIDAVNATRLQVLPNLSLRGQDTLVGFIDTGIDYTHPAFLTSSGLTRIQAIWDQTIEPSPFSSNGIINIPFGTVYEYTDINKALQSESPLSIVPSRDTNGHGTFLAGVCAGSDITDDNFSGVVPDADILVVKLKQAKRYLRTFFLIKDDVPCFQEDDIMSAVYFMINYATILKKPIVICIGLGSSQGAHTGNSPLSNMLNEYSLKTGCAICIAMGNEGDNRTHYSGTILENEEFEDVELRVAPGEESFSMELWGQPPELLSISVISPSGEVVPRIPARLGQREEYSFLFDNTKLYVEYSLVESLSGAELILLRFVTPSEGIWKLRVFSRDRLNARFNIWLPINQFINAGTYFLESSPDITLTAPAGSQYPMSIAAYNHYNNSLYISSGRGFTVTGVVKPDFAAPGVNVFGPVVGGRYTTKNGTSIAAALAAGVAAQFMTWAITYNRQPSLTGYSLKNYLIRGAKRNENETYPNNTLGYGFLDAFNSFDIIRSD